MGKPDCAGADLEGFLSGYHIKKVGASAIYRVFWEKS